VTDRADSTDGTDSAYAAHSNSAAHSTADAHSTPATHSAREYILQSHSETVETVLQCADGVAETWDRDDTTDPQSVVGPLRASLEAAGAWERLPDVLAGAVRATDHSLSATPVAAPPYVIATSRGPMLRATLEDGRLVILLQTFDVEQGPPTKYVRGASTPEAAVRASFK
jgi:hypothetical protein